MVHVTKKAWNKEELKKLKFEIICMQGKWDKLVFSYFSLLKHESASYHQLPFVQLMQNRKTWIWTIRAITRRVKENYCIQSQKSCERARTICIRSHHFPSDPSKDTAAAGVLCLLGFKLFSFRLRVRVGAPNRSLWILSVVSLKHLWEHLMCFEHMFCPVLMFW